MLHVIRDWYRHMTFTNCPADLLHKSIFEWLQHDGKRVQRLDVGAYKLFL